MTHLLVLAWGNPSRGDDALGPEFLRCAEAMVSPAAHDIEFVADFQLQPEHATDIAGRDLVLFVDASMVVPAPFTFSAVVPSHDYTFTSHAMSPGALLAAFRDAFLQSPPPAFLLAIRGERFGLGEPMSAAAGANLGQALAFFDGLLADAGAVAWARSASGPK